MRTVTWLAVAAKVALAAKPNIVFILTDDQDAKMDSLSYMPNVQELLINQGTNYVSHYCTVSLCCPSRVSMWTGRAAHNTNVTDIVAPYGGYPKFIEQGLNDDWFPVWAQDAGVNVYYTGKLMNSYGSNNYNNPFPRGFAGTAFFTEPWTYLYFDPWLQKNQAAPVEYQGSYTNDLVSSVSVDMIDEAVASGKQFVVVAAPVGPHSAKNPKLNYSAPPQPPNRYVDLYPNATVPRTDNFNPNVASGANWVASLERQTQATVDAGDFYYRRRLQTLKSIDDMVAALVNRLDYHDVLNNTFIIYTSDNGYHIGQHRMLPGKITGYEEDVNVPFIIRGPGVPQGQSVDFVSSHTDIAPTLLQMLDVPFNLTSPDAAESHQFDGKAIPHTAAGINKATASSTRAEHVNVEFWGLPSNDNNVSYPTWIYSHVNTYKGVRIVSKDYAFYYQVWCQGDHELYDMKADPGQMKNLYNSSGTAMGRPISQLMTRLDAVLLVLKTCKGFTCRQPWTTLQPNTNVNTLVDAMDEKFDAFYGSQPNVAWSECDRGFIESAEGPMWESDGKVYRRSLVEEMMEWT